MGGPDPHRLVRKKLKQRSKTLKSKAIELATQCDAEVYLLICSSRETYVYNSNKDDPSWPPPDHDLVLLRKHSVYASTYIRLIYFPGKPLCQNYSKSTVLSRLCIYTEAQLLNQVNGKLYTTRLYLRILCREATAAWRGFGGHGKAS